MDFHSWRDPSLVTRAAHPFFGHVRDVAQAGFEGIQPLHKHAAVRADEDSPRCISLFKARRELDAL
jgi:hypothetical protein